MTRWETRRDVRWAKAIASDATARAELARQLSPSEPDDLTDLITTYDARGEELEQRVDVERQLDIGEGTEGLPEYRWG